MCADIQNKHVKRKPAEYYTPDERLAELQALSAKVGFQMSDPHYEQYMAKKSSSPHELLVALVNKRKGAYLDYKQYDNIERTLIKNNYMEATKSDR